MPNIDLNKYSKNKRASPKTAVKTADSGIMDLLNREITFGNGELKDKKKEYLYLELSSLLSAGINLKSSLELISGEQEKESDKKLYTQIQKAVIGGESFSNALKKTAKFSLYEVFSLQIGEESGKLVEVLQDLAKFYKNKIMQRRKIISALTYPVIVLSTSFGAVFFMLKFVVPMFADVFKRFGGKLPWITAQIMRVSAGMENYFWFMLMIIASVSGLIYFFRRAPTFRAFGAALVLRLPIAGEMVQKIYLARFCNSMRLLISAKLPLLQAISLIRQMISYYPLEVSLEKIEKDILSGKSLHESLQAFAIYPPKMIQLIRIGEETNQMDIFFARIADQYVEEIEYKSSTLSSALEPLIIIFLGLIVGTILISMYLPLMQMSNSFQ